MQRRTRLYNLGDYIRDKPKRLKIKPNIFLPSEEEQQGYRSRYISDVYYKHKERGVHKMIDFLNKEIDSVNDEKRQVQQKISKGVKEKVNEVLTDFKTKIKDEWNRVNPPVKVELIPPPPKIIKAKSAKAKTITNAPPKIKIETERFEILNSQGVYETHFNTLKNAFLGLQKEGQVEYKSPSKKGWTQVINHNAFENLFKQNKGLLDLRVGTKDKQKIYKIRKT